MTTSEDIIELFNQCIFSEKDNIVNISEFRKKLKELK